MQFHELLPDDFLDQLQTEAGVKRNNCVYSPLVTMWLMMLQRLHCGASLESAVLELLRGLPPSFWPNPCKRIRRWQEDGTAPSSNTGAYNLARQALSPSIVQKSYDRMFAQMVSRMDQTASQDAPRAFLLDGSSIRMPHTPELCKLYPPGSNQHGEGHWPVLRILVAHDIYTGLAMRPEWGPMYGPEAVSEQELLTRAIDRLPKDATGVSDANFGIFWVAYTFQQHERSAILRLTADRARCLAGGELQDGIDRELVWKPSIGDRRRHPDLPADASVAGRLIVRRVQPTNGDAFLLPIFTTLRLPEAEILAIYGQRWNIESDLRTLKSDLRLEELTCSTADMVAKEIDMGMAAYNLVRYLIHLAAQQSGIPPRCFSFSKVRKIIEIFGPALANAANEEEAKRIFEQIMRLIQQSKLPHRKRKRPSYPRAVWKRRDSFPKRKK